MGGTRGKRVQGKKKPKAVKAKVTAKMNSKRRFSRMGKEAKKVRDGRSVTEARIVGGPSPSAPFPQSGLWVVSPCLVFS